MQYHTCKSHISGTCVCHMCIIITCCMQVTSTCANYLLDMQTAHMNVATMKHVCCLVIANGMNGMNIT